MLEDKNNEHEDPKVTLTAAVIHLLVMITNSRLTQQPLEPMLEEAHAQLEKGVNAAAFILSKGVSDSDTTNIVSLSVQQMQSALEEKNYEGFLKTISTLLEGLNIPLESLLGDVGFLGKNISSMAQNIANKESDQPLTGIINVV